jgi:hypothetical protein
MVECCEDFLKSFIKDEDFINKGFYEKEKQLEV